MFHCYKLRVPPVEIDENPVVNYGFLAGAVLKPLDKWSWYDSGIHKRS